MQKMMYLGEQEEQKAQSPCLARHGLIPRTSAPPPSQAICSQGEAIEHIQVGSFYEIDHSKLPLRAPEQLKQIRIVMVSDKASFKVSLRFPSIHSLQTHFSENQAGKQLPSLDEKYVMAPEMASEVLYRRVKPREIAERSNLWSFWAVQRLVVANQRNDDVVSSPTALSGGVMSSVISKKGPCLTRLKFAGMVQWGKRRQVRYLRRHEPSSSYGGTDEEPEKKTEDDAFYVEEEEQEEGDDDEDVKADQVEDLEAPPVEVKRNLRSSSKRKRHEVRRKMTIQKSKRSAKRHKQNQIVAVNNEKKKMVKSDSVARWSAGRYKLAEENMLKVMKAKGAAAGKPILRPALRSEARKLIGDTGLLDHLLKHMAGKVAPGGAERFRRRHNADGAMEYWLESADLVNIRKEAGVQDPYWTPPPGWKPGDNPTQDPICAREIRELREEVAQMKREHMLKRQEDLAIVTTPHSLTSPNWDHEGSLIGLQEMYTEQVIRKAKIEEQLMKVSQSLSEIEEQMGMLKTAMEEPGLISEAEEPPPTSDSERETKEMAQKNKSIVLLESGVDHEQEEDKGSPGGDNKASGAAAAARTLTEDKAAKIERLRSGFRICKPQGTFLWPNMGMSPQQQIVVHQNDPFAVPTPPSASSSTNPTSPLLKPLAERRPVNTATFCNVTQPPPPSPIFPPPPPDHHQISPTKSAQSITITKTLLINLNELPNAQNTDTTTAFSGTLTYQRRHQNVTSNAAMPRMVRTKKGDDDGGDAGKDSMMHLIRYSEQQHEHEQRWCSSSSTSTSSWMPTSMGDKWWGTSGN